MMTPQYVDVHTHLNFAAYDGDREEVLARMKDAGVWAVNVGTQQDTSKKAVELAEKHEGLFAIVGLHPIHTDASRHDTDELGEEGKAFTSRGEVFEVEVYEKLMSHPKVVGIGECGLDYFRLSLESEKKQREAFDMHIALAEKTGKPLMLHVRNPKDGARSAYKDATDMLRGRKVSGNVHFFAGSIDEAKMFLDLGFTLSFTGVITFARNYDEVIRYLPAEGILSETDAPYVTPAPYRGRRNEPVFVREVAAAIADIRGEKREKMAEQLVQNAIKTFCLR